MKTMSARSPTSCPKCRRPSMAAASRSASSRTGFRTPNSSNTPLEHKLGEQVELREIKAGDVVELGPFKVEFIHVAHSIPDTTALAIQTPVGMVIHSGDFKMDQTPVDGQPTDMARLSHFGNRGVLLLMSD